MGGAARPSSNVSAVGAPRSRVLPPTFLTSTVAIREPAAPSQLVIVASMSRRPHAAAAWDAAGEAPGDPDAVTVGEAPGLADGWAVGRGVAAADAQAVRMKAVETA